MGFGIRTNPPFSVRKLSLVNVSKKTCQIQMNNQIQIRRPAEDIVNNKKNIYQIMNYIKLNEQLEKYLNLRVLTKTRNMKWIFTIIGVGSLAKKFRKTENPRKNSADSITKFSENIYGLVQVFK